MKGRFLPLWCVAVLATAAAFVVHLSIRFETVRLGYEVSDERGRQRQLLQDRRMLSIEAATLRQSGRIETIARGTLGMEVPKPTRIVTMKEKGESHGRGEGAVKNRWQRWFRARIALLGICVMCVATASRRSRVSPSNRIRRPATRNGRGPASSTPSRFTTTWHHL